MMNRITADTVVRPDVGIAWKGPRQMWPSKKAQPEIKRSTARKRKCAVDCTDRQQSQTVTAWTVRRLTMGPRPLGGQTVLSASVAGSDGTQSSAHESRTCTHTVYRELWS